MGDYFGRIFGIMLSFLLIGVAPFVWLTMSNEMVARRTVMNEMQMFIDEVIDTRQVSDEQLEDFYLGISGLGPVLDVRVDRYVRTVNPDPKHPGEVYITYVYTDNNREFSQGDKVQVNVKAIAYTGSQKFMQSLIGMVLPKIDYTFAGRVR